MNNILQTSVRCSYEIVKCAHPECTQLGFRDDGCPDCREYRCESHKNLVVRRDVDDFLETCFLGAEGATCLLCKNTNRQRLGEKVTRGEVNFNEEFESIKEQLVATDGRRKFFLLLKLKITSMLSEIDKFGDNPLEMDLYAEMIIRNLDRYFTPQVEVYGDHENFISRVDFASLLLKIAIYTDGRTYHSSEEQIEKDNRQRGALQRLGWIVLKYWSEEVFENPSRVADEIYQVTCRRILELGDFHS